DRQSTPDAESVDLNVLDLHDLSPCPANVGEVPLRHSTPMRVASSSNSLRVWAAASDSRAVTDRDRPGCSSVKGARFKSRPPALLCRWAARRKSPRMVSSSHQFLG